MPIGKCDGSAAPSEQASLVRGLRLRKSPCGLTSVRPQLGPNEIDPVSGTLFWPAALQDDVFQENRLAVSDIAAKWVRYGGLTYDERTGLAGHSLHGRYIEIAY